MKPQEEGATLTLTNNASPEVMHNGVTDAGDVGEEEEGEGEEEAGAWLTLEEPGAVVEALRALNALRKSRQYYDVVLLAGGAEVPAHRAVLAAASPHLLEAFTAAGGAQAGAYLVTPASASAAELEAEAEALRALVEYAYTGAVRVRGSERALALYRAAWRLRMEAVRARAADHLVRHAAPADCLRVRALPDLAPHHIKQLDHYIAHNFRRLCEMSALAGLPVVRLELLRESGAVAGLAAGGEAARAVAAAALAYLRELLRTESDLEAVCARRHLVFWDAEGALRDCERLPARRHDAPELAEYRREAAARPRPPPPRAAPAPLLQHRVGARSPAPRWSVLAAQALADNALLALADLRDSLAQVSVSWRTVQSPVVNGGDPFSPAGSDGARSDDSAGADDDDRLAQLSRGRCAHGLATLGGRLVVCGGYDRAEVLRSAEAYDPARNAWRPLPDMRRPRARFALAALAGALYAVGGSDGHNDLETVDRFTAEGERGAWSKCAPLGRALALSAVCADEEAGALYCVGGSGGGAGAGLRLVQSYRPREDRWAREPELAVGRAAACAVWWPEGGGVWALGGSDAWHCLASTERLAAVGAGAEREWREGPALPTARRSVGGAVWRGRLVALGGSDGATSLRRVDWLEAGADEWRAGPRMREARASLGAAVLGDVLYAVGGFSGKEFLSSLECLTSPDGEWTTLVESRLPAPAPALRRYALPEPPPPQDGERRDETEECAQTNGAR